MNKVVFFGTGPVAAASLKSLMGHFEIEQVITKPRNPRHKGIVPVEELAAANNLPLAFANTKLELDQLFDAANFNSRLGIIVDYGVIVSSRVIKSFELGIINSHFSLLPEWRGADPITFSILSGQPATGVSLMLVEPELDTGQLISQEPINIDPADTTPSLTQKLINLSNQLLAKYIPLYLDGQVTPYPQSNPEQATYSRRLNKADSQLDPNTKTAAELERQVRAFIDFPKSKLTLLNTPCVITASHVAPQPKTSIDPKCADGNYLIIDQLIPENSKKMTAEAFLNGHQK
ncbi:methionyl-tRNA formyltransferase [Candidatus Saccharibacteria bacterium]|nr:methionyl-tRNA formyltransferase [Candidatus Saccharibacteria bacterium]